MRGWPKGTPKQGSGAMPQDIYEGRRAHARAVLVALRTRLGREPSWGEYADGLALRYASIPAARRQCLSYVVGAAALDRDARAALTTFRELTGYCPHAPGRPMRESS